MISNLRPSKNAPVYDAANEGVKKQLQVFTKMIQLRSFLVFLRSTSHHDTFQLFLSKMREIFTLSGNVPATSEYFRRISEDFPMHRKLNVRRMFRKTFEPPRRWEGFFIERLQICLIFFFLSFILLFTSSPPCNKYIFFGFNLLSTSSPPCRKDQFAVLYFSTSLIVLIQVYKWEIRHPLIGLLLWTC